MQQSHLWKSPRPQTIKGRILLEYSNEEEYRLCQEVWSTPETCWHSPCPGQTSIVDDFALTFLLVRCGDLGLIPLALVQLKFLIWEVYYFTKWIESEVVTKITVERVRCFYWQKIMCIYGLSGSIVSDNGTKFSSTMVTKVVLPIE